MNVVAGQIGLTRSTLKLGEVEIELYEGGRGPALLYFHGGGGLVPNAPFLQALSRKFRVIAPVHPGFGASSLPLWLDCVDDYAHLYLELIDRLALSDIVLLGHSLGGWTAAELAAKSTHAIARIVLVAPIGIKVGPVDKLDIPDIYAMPQDQLDALLYADPEKFRPDPSKLTDAELLTRARNRQTLALITWEPYMHNPKLKHRLHRIGKPTLVIRGAQDGLVSKDYAAAYAGLIPGARLVTIDGAGHSPHIEQAERFVSEIERFAGGQS
jgi:pimeloyl-ACP methyl ester carboxylesterase